MQVRRARWIAILAVLALPLALSFGLPLAGLSQAADLPAAGETGGAPAPAAPRADRNDPDFPALTGRVVDGAGMLSSAARDALTRDLAAHESATGQQVVVVTVPTLGGRPIEDFGYQLGRRWGIGRAGEDDGALLIVAAEERQVRIEVGYGLEGTLTDAQSWGVIQSYMVPNFRTGNYEAGIVAGAGAVLAILRGDAPPPPPREARQAAERDREEGPGGGGLLFWIIVIFILLNAFGRGGRRGRRSALPWIILGGLGGMRGGPGGGRSGGFGGGGFGGGGGGFGGGGASGSW
jgi:uncharacterized protein